MPIVHPDTGITTTTVVLGLVKYIHVRNDVLTPKRTVDLAKLQAVGALGDISYARIVEAFRIPRFSWDEISKQVENLEQVTSE